MYPYQCPRPVMAENGGIECHVGVFSHNGCREGWFVKIELKARIRLMDADPFAKFL